jgi:anti-anti-sigma factor
MFSVENHEKLVVITCEQHNLNSLLAPDLKNEFQKIIEQGQRNIALDVSAVKYCDSTGLSAILVGNRLCRNAGGMFVLCGVKDMVEKLIKLSKLDTLLNIVPSPGEAIDVIIMTEIEKEFDNDDV